MPDFKFAIWLDPLELAGITERTLFVRAPDHIRTWVRDRYLPLVRDAARRGLYADASVEIVDGRWRAPGLAIPVDSATDGAGGTYTEAGVAGATTVPGHHLLSRLVGTADS